MVDRELHSLQGVAGTQRTAQSMNAVDRAIDNTCQFSSVSRSAIFPQTPLRFIRRKPSRIASGFLRRTKPQDLAKMRIHREIRALGITRSALTPRVTCKRGLFHASVNTGFFERLECRGLGVSKSGLRHSPSETSNGPRGFVPQRFDSGAAHAITDGRDLLDPRRLRRWDKATNLEDGGKARTFAHPGGKRDSPALMTIECGIAAVPA